MRLPSLCALLSASLLVTARADLTIVQKVEGAGPVAEMTIKVKGDKARIDVTPQLSTIIDGKSGEMINLMMDQKAAVRVSAEKMKAAAEMISKYTEKEQSADKPKLKATGKKDKVNGYDADEYMYEAPHLKATYWIALTYPDGAAILKEMQALKSEAWSAVNTKMPDYRDFPGIPIKTVIFSGDNQITSTIVSIKRDPLNDAEFSVPKDFEEKKTPEISNMLEPGTRKPASDSTPQR